jgi:hypothetical protein
MQNNRSIFYRSGLSFLALFALFVAFSSRSFGWQSPVAAADAAAGQPYLEEWVYRVKWGHSDEFYQLLKKYQLAILEREKQLGYVTQYVVYKPALHTSEDQRWDYRVFIVFKNHAAADKETQIAKQLFPDQQTFKREENHRWELIDAHWDLPLELVDPNTAQ